MHFVVSAFEYRQHHHLRIPVEDCAEGEGSKKGETDHMYTNSNLEVLVDSSQLAYNNCFTKRGLQHARISRALGIEKTTQERPD